MLHVNLQALRISAQVLHVSLQALRISAQALHVSLHISAQALHVSPQAPHVSLQALLPHLQTLDKINQDLCITRFLILIVFRVDHPLYDLCDLGWHFAVWWERPRTVLLGSKYMRIRV